MGLNIQCESEYLNKKKIGRMWQAIADNYDCREDIVTVREVSERQIQDLNRKYRGKNKPTNVLTFSYDEREHDVSLCLALAKKEAEQRDVVMEEYVAMLLAHAFLHVVGMDHKDSTSEQEMRQIEMKYLSTMGFVGDPL